jgi:F0F1-type ATP synthase epsilon subunit
MFTKLYEGEAAEVILPGEDGEFSVWNFHQQCLYSLRRGIIRAVEHSLRKDSKKEQFKVLIKRGIANIMPLKVDIMVEV